MSDVEGIPQWNPTVIESKILRVSKQTKKLINSHAEREREKDRGKPIFSPFNLRPIFAFLENR